MSIREWKVYNWMVIGFDCCLYVVQIFMWVLKILMWKTSMWLQLSLPGPSNFLKKYFFPILCLLFLYKEISNYCNDLVSNQCKTFNLSFDHISCTTLFQFGSFTIMFSSVVTQVFCCSQILNHVVFNCLYLITLICLSLVIGFPKYRGSWTM
jgi:hypothetical protein